MSRLLAWLVAAAVAASAAWARADVISPQSDGVAVTIYRGQPADSRDRANPYWRPSGLALVSEKRTVTLAAGRTRIMFESVADSMIPQTANVQGLPGEVVEQNFDYDLLSPGSVIAKSVGQPVRRITTSPNGQETVQDAILRSGPQGVMLQIGDRFEALHCSGLPERLVFAEIPGGLADRPVLSMLVNVRTAGRYTLTLAYLATGFDWSADYVARIDRDGRKLDLSGWITLVNRNGFSFSDAPVEVVAGGWNRASGDGSDTPPPVAQTSRDDCFGAIVNDVGPHLAAAPPGLDDIVVTGSRIPTSNLTDYLAKMRELGDYKLYALPVPTTVAAQQTKQVALIDQHGAPFRRVYGYRLAADAMEGLSIAGGGDLPATVMLRVKNEKSAHLGLPIPAGVVSVMEEDAAGRAVLTGQDRVDDTPVGLPLEVVLGRAPDVRVMPRVVSRTDDSSGSRDEAYDVAVSNGKPVPIAFELRFDPRNDTDRVVSESQSHGAMAGRPVWAFRLRPGQRKMLHFVVRRRAVH